MDTGDLHPYTNANGYPISKAKFAPKNFHGILIDQVKEDNI